MSSKRVFGECLSATRRQAFVDFAPLGAALRRRIEASKMYFGSLAMRAVQRQIAFGHSANPAEVDVLFAALDEALRQKHGNGKAEE